MYKFLFIAAVFFGVFGFTTGVVLASPITPGSFSSTWKTDNAGTSGSNQITIPTTGSGFNYDVYWEEVGNDTVNGSSTGHTGNLTITFPTAGTYRVDITGSFPRIYFNNGGDRQKILTVEQWGNIAWASMENAFFGANNLQILASDTPDLSLVTDIRSIFRGATAFNQSINNWDVSNVTQFGAAFASASNFNQPLNSWNVSSAINMNSVFAGATNFNQSLASWNVSSVTDMAGMFQNATSFNQSLNSWNVSSVTSMNNMFLGAAAFNQPLNNWVVTSVTDMEGMFSGASMFNQAIGSWNVANVTLLKDTFNGAASFNQTISAWNVSSVTTMERMFQSATTFNQSINSWNVANVTNMDSLFSNASAFNQPLNSWNVSSVTTMDNMFNAASAFNQTLSSWNVANVTTMTSLFSSTALSTANYSSILTGWGALPTLQTSVSLVSPASYCSSASSSRAVLSGTYSWSITDGGSVECYTLSYSPGVNATLIGLGTQGVIAGEDGDSVEIIPDSGYVFVRWSDNVTDNPRTDLAITGDITVTAVLELSSTGGGSSSSGGGGGSRPRSQSTSTSTILDLSVPSSTEAVTDASFVASVNELLTFLSGNETKISNLPESEKAKVITLLQAIILYLMSILIDLQ